MKERNVVLILAMVLVVACTLQAQVITDVDRADGVSGDRTPIGVYDGDSNSLPTEAGGLIAGNYVFSDRDYLWAPPPAQLNGVEYIRTFNSDKGSSTVTYTVTTSATARIFIGMDQRFSEGDAAARQAIVDAIVAPFAPAGKFTDAGIGPMIAVDGNFLMLYWADMDPNTLVFNAGALPNSNNFITIGAIDPAFNPAPVVDAGPDQIAWEWPVPPPFQLDGSVDDADPLDGSAPGTLTYYWDETDPDMTFSDAGILNPTVTFATSGTKVLTLIASDGDKTIQSTVTIKLKQFGVDKPSILLYTKCKDGEHDDTLIAWLESIGYDVDKTGMNNAFDDGQNIWVEGSAGNLKLASAVARNDIVFVSRHTGSGDLAGNGGQSGWNKLDIPLLLNGNAAAIEGDIGSARWGWTSGNDAGTENWRTMDLRAGGSVDIFDFTLSANGKVPDGRGVGRFKTDSDEYINPNADVIADYEGTGSRPFWAEFPAGTDFDAGQFVPTTDKYGTSVAKRTFFGHWGYDDSVGKGPNGTDGVWESYLTQGYKDSLQQALFNLFPDPTVNPAPTVDAGPVQAIYIDVTDTVTLAGTATDDPPDFGDPGVLTITWSQLSGPVPGATITAPGDLDTTVTFTAAGTYDLLLTATDGDKDANDIVRIQVLEKAMVGYWPFDGDALDASVNSNHGTFAQPEQGYPQYDIDAAIGTASISLADPNATDPNMPHIDLGAATELDFSTNDWTVCAWVKTTQPKGSGDVGKATIFGNGADATPGHRYCLINNEDSEGYVDLVTDDDADKNTARTVGKVNDDNWHFVVGLRDGAEIRIYRDGVLEDTEGLPAVYDLSGTSQWNSRIGIIANADNGSLYKHFTGKIDDVRVYNYALSEADILALTAVGPIVASVDAGPDEVFPWKPGRELTLSGVVSDNGSSDSGANIILWSTESGPGVAEAVFTDATDPGTNARFPVPGVYVLKLSVVDPDAPGADLLDTVEITVVAPTCEEVLADGFRMPGDVTGGGLLGDEPDCYVGLDDLVIILSNWLGCNVPLDPLCEWPF